MKNENSGVDMIAAARFRQMLAESPLPSALDTLATAGAHLAKAMDLLQAEPQIVVPVGNLLRPKMIRLNADGQHLPDKEEADPFHVATLLPQYGLIIDVSRPEKHSDWQATNEAGKKPVICGTKADGLLEVDEWGLIIDRKFHSPAVNKKYFPNFRTDYIYWTATPMANPSDSGCAWCVSLNSGSVYYYGRNFDGLAVGCRRVSPSQ